MRYVTLFFGLQNLEKVKAVLNNLIRDQENIDKLISELKLEKARLHLTYP